METSFRRLGSHAINFGNIAFVTKEPGDTIKIHFVSKEEPLTFYKSSVEAQELLKWWESISPLVGGKVTSMRNPWG